MKIDVYPFYNLSWFFQNFLCFLYSVLRVSPKTDPSRRDRFVLVLAESAAETVTLNHACSETLFRLRNLYPKSTQNIDDVSSINLPNPSISCLISDY